MVVLKVSLTLIASSLNARWQPSEHADHLELGVVLVFPEVRSAEVRIVQELATALGPPHGLHFSVSPEESWI